MHRINGRKAAGTLLFLFALITGCATFTPDKKAGKDLLLSIAEVNAYAPALKMSGYASIKGRNGWVKSRVAVLISRPGSMRVTLFDPAGMALFVGTANNETVSYATADKKRRKTIPRERGQIFSIGRMEIAVDDLIRFIHPGLEMGWLKGGVTTMREEKLRVAYEGVVTDLEFDSQNRLEKISIEREDGDQLNISYLYLPGSLSVNVNGEVVFEFTKIEKVDGMPETFFNPIVIR